MDTVIGWACFTAAAVLWIGADMWFKHRRAERIRAERQRRAWLEQLR